VLTAYEDHKNRNDLPEPPEPLAGSILWKYFLSELEDISQHKYYESERAGYNVGAE